MEEFINQLQTEVVMRITSSWGDYITHYAPHTIKEKAMENGISLTDEEALTIASEINSRIEFLSNVSQKNEASADYKKISLLESGLCYNALKTKETTITFRNPYAILMEAQERGLNITPEEAEEIAAYVNGKIEAHNNALQNKNER